MGFLENLIQRLTRAPRTFIPSLQEGARTAGALAKGLSGTPVTVPQGQDYFGLTPEESEEFSRDPFKQGIKAGSTLLSYGMPVGPAASAATPAARIGTAAAKSVVPGTMSGFGMSDEGNELQGALMGGAIGGLLGGVTQGVSEASQAIKLNKLQKQLSNKANDFEVSSYIKNIGRKPTNKLGNMNLAKESKKLADDFGVKINSADDLAQFSDDLLDNFGPTASEYAQELSQLGGKIDIEEVLEPLTKELAAAKTETIRKPLEKVINEARAAAGPERMIDPEVALALRREWGPLGNWNVLTPTSERVVASAWEKAYMNMNNALDDAFREVGMNNFKEVNKILHTAIQQKNWARQAIATVNEAPVWTDMAQDAVFFTGGNLLSGGNPLAGLGGYLASKGLQRYGNPMVGGLVRGAEGAAGAAAGMQGAVPGAMESLQQLSPLVGLLQGSGASPYEGASEQGMGMPGMQPEMEQGGIDKTALAALVLSGQLSTTDAKFLLELLGTDGAGGGATTEAGRKFQFALDSANNILQMLDQTGALAGPLQGIRTGVTSAVGGATEYTALANEIESLRSIIFNALGGTNLTPNEQKQYEKFIPKVTDTKAQVRQKLQTLIPKLQDLMGSSSSTGQDTSALYDMLGLEDQWR